MGSDHRAARRERRVLRQLEKELSAIPGFGETRRPSPHVAKDFLGAAFTLAIVGVFGLQVTNGLASQCATGPKPHAHPACSGVAAVARHAQPAVTLIVISCAALAVMSFAWYMLWGYKTSGQARENRDTSGR
jgi:formate hydrogenlyase subunit 3/multisubunit Na+/H+ antiporter MnhD subunit